MFCLGVLLVAIGGAKMSDYSASRESVANRMRKILIALIIVVLALAAYQTARVVARETGDANAGTNGSTAEPAVAVAVTRAREELWKPSIKATGSLRAYQGVKVTAQEKGLITEIHFQSGRRVSKGDVLVQQYVKSEWVRLSGLKAELSLARKSYDRSQSLIGKQAVSQSQLDSTLSDLERMTALVQNLEVTISKRTIRAPFDGVLGIRQVDVGQYIEPGDEIVSLEALDPIYVEFTLPQNRLPQARIGQQVSIEVDAYPGEEFSGAINAIEPLVDSATRTFLVQAQVANDQLKLRPGMFVNTRLLLPLREKVLTLPQAAISYNPYGNSVYIVDRGPAMGGGTARSVYVSLGETRGDQVAVLSGIQPGDLVVTAGQLRLRNGAAVTIDEGTVIGNNAEPVVDDS